MRRSPCSPRCRGWACGRRKSTSCSRSGDPTSCLPPTWGCETRPASATNSRSPLPRRCCVAWPRSGDLTGALPRGISGAVAGCIAPPRSAPNHTACHHPSLRHAHRRIAHQRQARPNRHRNAVAAEPRHFQACRPSGLRAYPYADEHSLKLRCLLAKHARARAKTSIMIVLARSCCPTPHGRRTHGHPTGKGPG